MTEIVHDSGGSVPLDILPPAALQALYHRVTGKTESMTQHFEGNVVICQDDVDRLHQMIRDQLATHNVEFGPTVSVEIKHANERAFKHSSWEHFKTVVPVANEVTSEITIKFESILQLQNTDGPQRCVINIHLDSALPLIKDQDDPTSRPWAFWMFVTREWKAVSVSIDFVDFMIARGFVNVIEEWFRSLQETETPKFNKRLLDAYDLFSSITGQAGRLGFAVFLAIYLWQSPDPLPVKNLGLACCLALALWSLFGMLRPIILSRIFKRLTANIIPTVIILTDFDKKSYAKVKGSMNSTGITILTMALTPVLSVGLNVLSSYIYAYLTLK